MFLAVYQLRQKKLGDDHIQTIRAMNQLAQIYQIRHKYKKSEQLYEACLQLRLTVLGENHLDTLLSVNNLGTIYQIQNKNEQAQEQFIKALGLSGAITGENHANYLNSLNALGNNYRIQGKYKEAKPLFEKARLISIELYGHNHMDTLISYNNLGSLYQELGEYETALPIFQKAFEISTQMFGDSELVTIIIINNLASLYQALGTYDQAETLFDKALKLNIALFGTKHGYTIASFNNLANLYLVQGLYDKAQPQFEIVLNLSREVSGEKHPNTLSALNNLASLYQAQGQYNRSLPLYQKTLKLRKEVLGEHHPDTISSINALAGIYMLKGQFVSAMTLFSSAYEARKKIFGEEHPDTIGSLENIAILRQSQADYEKAQPIFEKILQLRQKHLGGNHPDSIRSIASLASLYKDQGRFDKAELKFQSALKLQKENLGENHPDTLTTMDQLSGLYQQQGLLEKAFQYAEASFKKRSVVLGEEHPDTVASLGNLASIYQLMGKYELARPLVEKSVSLYISILGRKHPSTIIALNNLAQLYQFEKQYQKASELFKEVYELSSSVLGQSHPNSLISLNNLAAAHQSQGEYEPTNSLWKKSLKTTNMFLDQVLWGSDNETRQAYINMQRKAKAYLLSFYLQHNRPETAREALLFSLTRKGLRLKITSEINTVVRAGHNPQLRRTAKLLNQYKQKLAAMMLKGPGNKEPQDFADEVEKTQQIIEKMEAFLGYSVQQFRRSKISVTPEDIKKSLKADQLLVDFLVFNEIDAAKSEIVHETIIAIVVSNDKENPFTIVDLGSTSVLKSKTKEFLSEISNPESDDGIEYLDELAQNIHSILWQPLLPYLEGKKTVFIVPDGIINLLPLNALKDEQGRYIVESFHLVHLSSAREIALPSYKGEQTSPVVFAAPVYNDHTAEMAAELKKTKISHNSIFSGISFDPLPGTAIEAQTLMKAFKEKGITPRLYSQKEATELNLSKIKSPRILHLATHGFFLTPDTDTDSSDEISTDMIQDDTSVMKPVENPMLRAGLAFTSSNYGFKGIKRPDGTDGVLSALEALTLDLVGTDLVILSACETGVGDIQAGEGVYGLRRALQEAGAKSVTSTLWTISDSGTQKFMTGFYHRILEGDPPQKALRDMQLDFLAEEEMSHPFYWAPFVMFGVF